MKPPTRRHARRLLLGLTVLLVVVLGTQWRAAIRRNRSMPDEPFRIAGNLYYVGSTGVTSFLLTGPEGHVLNSHAHFDHAAGLRELQEAARKRRESVSAADPVAPFIDREGYHAYIDRAERLFREKLADQQSE